MLIRVRHVPLSSRWPRALAGLQGPPMPDSLKTPDTAVVPTAPPLPASRGCVPSALELRGGARGGDGGGAPSGLRCLTRAILFERSAAGAKRVVARAPGPRSKAESTRRGARPDASNDGAQPPLAREVVASNTQRRQPT